MKYMGGTLDFAKGYSENEKSYKNIEIHQEGQRMEGKNSVTWREK